MAGSEPSPETSRRATTTAFAVAVVALVVLAAGGVVALGVQPPTASDATPNATSAPATPAPTPTPTAEDDGSTADAETDGSDGSASGGSSSDDASSDGSGSDDSAGDASATTPERPFTIAIENIETCGNTCRDVTVSLTNNGGNARTGVAVTTTMYAGENAGENPVWTGEQSIGRLGPDAATTRTKRVKVGFLGGAKIKRNGGTVTVETVVRWDGGSVTFTERKQVA